MSTTSAACAASLGALLFGLGLAVSLARTKASRFAGYPPESSAFLHKLVRAHGNTAEYAPFVALLIPVCVQDETNYGILRTVTDDRSVLWQDLGG